MENVLSIIIPTVFFLGLIWGLTERQRIQRELKNDKKETPKPDPEAHAPMDAYCEKCGRRYCDHEDKY